jgi:hypothetical protein
MNGFFLALAVGMLAGPQSPAQEPAAPPESFQPYEARLTGSNVYVRSGPSTVYYHTAKLQHGDIVRVVGQQYGFAEIEPPQDSFSLIAKDYVEVHDDGLGVLNGEAWVLAYGPDTPEAYAKQVKLQMDDEVQIVDEINDYYRIVPPAGATLWISREFIAPVGEETAASPEPASVSSGPATTATAANSGSAGSKPAAAQRSTPAAGPTESTKPVDPQHITEVADIRQLEETLQRELKKEKPQRSYGPIIQGFQQVGESHPDEGVRQYAQYRADQLMRSLDRNQALVRIHEIDAQVQAHRREFSEQRSKIRPSAPPVVRDFAVTGKMLQSFAYTSPVGPRRYRIVDVDEGGQRTIAYIEIEPDSTINPQEFLGRHVGVRARAKRLIEGTAEPIVVYSAAEIIILEQPPADEASVSAASGQAVPRPEAAD